METQNVTIMLNSSIRHPGQDEETHELNAIGQYIKRAGRSYLKYEEEQSGNRIETTVKMGDEDALIMRRGAVDMRLPFNLDEERQGTYGSGPANFQLIVKTNDLEFAEVRDGFGGRFSVAYELVAEGSVLGTYELTITYTEGTS